MDLDFINIIVQVKTPVIELFERTARVQEKSEKRKI